MSSHPIRAATRQDKMNTKTELTASEIYSIWGIPRSMLREAVSSPCPVRYREVVRNGVKRKLYDAKDVAEYFGCELAGGKNTEVTK